MSLAETDGIVGLGKPWGRTPITSTPRAARSNATEAAIDTTTATRIPGVRGEKRFRPRIVTRLTSPIPSAQAFVWSRFWTKAIISPTRPLASVEKPNSLGSWPMKIVTARPAR